jgi:multidrug efflux system outer membrane protein
MKNKDQHPPARCRQWCLLLPLVLAGCSVGPDYQRPAVETPANFKSASDTDKASPQLGQNWWTLFGDPELNKLEEEAIQSNQNIKAAMASVDQARAIARETGSANFPTISFDPSAIRSRTSANAAPANSGLFGANTSRTETEYTLPFDLNYEVDIWGQVRRAVEAANAQVQVSLDQYEVVLQSLEADLAQDYFSLRSYDAQNETLTATVDTYRKQLALTQTEYKAGLEGEADVASAEALLDSTITLQEENSRLRQEEEFAIAVLLNQPPAEFSLPVNPLKDEPPIIPAGLPADLLRRRPDVAAAEHTLAAASAEVGVAVSQFYPQLSLTGDAGFESIKTSNLLDWESRIWSLGPSLSLPLFNGGKLQSELDQQKAIYQQDLAEYRIQVLSAYQDVENSLTDLHTRADEAKSQAAAVSASQDYVRLTDLQYRQGLLAYLDVIDANRTLLSNQLAAEQILNERLASTVLLIKALGGGWEAPQSAPPASGGSAAK